MFLVFIDLLVNEIAGPSANFASKMLDCQSYIMDLMYGIVDNLSR